MNIAHDIDLFDTSDIIDEFDKIENNSHCYAYLTVDIYKAVCRFCYDMKISFPSCLESLKSLKGKPIIFSESIYCPKGSNVRGKELYTEMVEHFDFYQPESLIGFIDCRWKKDSAEKLTAFYNSIDRLDEINSLGEHEGFVIKEQKILN